MCGMESFTIKTFLFGLFSLTFFSCEKIGTSGSNPSENFLGTWGICFDSLQCESVLDDGCMITSDSISKVELSGYKNTEHQSIECKICAKSSFTSWKYKPVATEKYSQQGDSISFSTKLGEDVTITLLNS